VTSTWPSPRPRVLDIVLNDLVTLTLTSNILLIVFDTVCVYTKINESISLCMTWAINLWLYVNKRQTAGYRPTFGTFVINSSIKTLWPQLYVTHHWWRYRTDETHQTWRQHQPTTCTKLPIPSATIYTHWKSQLCDVTTNKF